MNEITEQTTSHDLTKLSKQELLMKCEELGIAKCKSKNKGQVINLINVKLNEVSTTDANVPKEQEQEHNENINVNINIYGWF